MKQYLMKQGRLAVAGYGVSNLRPISACQRVDAYNEVQFPFDTCLAAKESLSTEKAD